MSARQRTRDIFVYVVGIVVVAGIVASFFVTRSEVHDVGTRVTKVESPCLRYGPKSPQCKAAFEAAVSTITHAEACAILRKAGLEVAQCAHARLRQERTRHNERAPPPKGVAPSTENSPSSQPSPQHGGPSVPAHPGGKSGGHGSPESIHQPSSTQPSESAPAPIATAPSPSQPEQVAGEATTPAPEASSPPGLIGSPGGLAGEVVCGLNRLLPVCSE